MGFIIFKKHPGDILSISNLKKRATIITIDKFNLHVDSIKLTSNWTFKVQINVLPNKKDYNYKHDLVDTLNLLLKDKSILEYSIE